MKTIALLLLCSLNGFAWTPDNVGFELAARSPNIGVKTDYFVGSDVEWTGLQIHTEYERENGEPYFNYRLDCKRDSRAWTVSASSNVSDAKSISSQKIAVRRMFWVLGVGVAGATNEYDANRLKGLMDFYIPLFRLGYLNYLTNFDAVKIWDAVFEYCEGDGRVRPYFKARFFKVPDADLDWLTSVGVKIKLTE